MPSWREVSPSPRHHRGRGVKISQWRWRPGHWGDNQGRMSHYNDCAKIRHNSPHCYREEADLLAHNQTFFSLSLSKIRSGTLAPSAITRGLSQPSDQRGLILPFFGPWKSSFFLLFTADFMCCHLDSVLSVSQNLKMIDMKICLCCGFVLLIRMKIEKHARMLDNFISI